MTTPSNITTSGTTAATTNPPADLSSSISKDATFWEAHPHIKQFTDSVIRRRETFISTPGDYTISANDQILAFLAGMSVYDNSGKIPEKFRDEIFTLLAAIEDARKSHSEPHQTDQLNEMICTAQVAAITSITGKEYDEAVKDLDDRSMLELGNYFGFLGEPGIAVLWNLTVKYRASRGSSGGGTERTGDSIKGDDELEVREDVEEEEDGASVEDQGKTLD